MFNARLAQYDQYGYRNSTMVKMLTQCFLPRKAEKVVQLKGDVELDQVHSHRALSRSVNDDEQPSPKKSLLRNQSAEFYDLENAVLPEEESEVKVISERDAEERKAPLHREGTQDGVVALENISFGAGVAGHPFWGQLGELAEKLDRETEEGPETDNEVEADMKVETMRIIDMKDADSTTSTFADDSILAAPTLPGRPRQLEF